MTEHMKEITVVVYNENAVCEQCGENDFHCNFFWKSYGCEDAPDKMFMGEDELGTNDVYCHVCDEQTTIINKENYEENVNKT